jgi:hypothetical protein
MRSAWLLDSGASRHMTETHELFSSPTKRDSDVQWSLVMVPGMQ